MGRTVLRAMVAMAAAVGIIEVIHAFFGGPIGDAFHWIAITTTFYDWLEFRAGSAFLRAAGTMSAAVTMEAPVALLTIIFWAILSRNDRKLTRRWPWNAALACISTMTAVFIVAPMGFLYMYETSAASHRLYLILESYMSTNWSRVLTWTASNVLLSLAPTAITAIVCTSC